jgi:hypothetical protein
MDDHQTPTTLLSEANAAFIQRGVSMNLASRDAGNAPAVARACGCRVSADRRRVTVFLSLAQSETVLGALAETGVIAAVFTRPSTNKTIQLKGSDARLEPLSAGDEALIAAYRESFVQDLVGIGYTRAFASAVVAGADERAVAVTFTPVAAFDQTPGRNAGRALG